MLDGKHAGFYGYDANDERVYKLTGKSEMGNVTDELIEASAYFDAAVLYPNPYITITPKGYTKHYYANGERLATSMGQGNLCKLSHDVISYPETEHEIMLLEEGMKIYNDEEYPFEYHHEPLSSLTINVDIIGHAFEEVQYVCPLQHLKRLRISYEPNILLRTLQDYCEAHGEERDIFYRHSDHLGSASWITDRNGTPVQYLHYLPYGQLYANQTLIGYDERFKFTGKERDAETGYDYFGARYYVSPFMHFISVEPLIDRYLFMSPYAYCAWNPVKYIDPDGRWSISVHASSNRAKSPYAIYKVHNRHGDVIYQTVVKVKGYKGPQYRDRRITNGDTPTGRYKMNKWKEPKDSRYGVNDLIDQTYLEGEGKGPGTNNRDYMHTHGGGDILNENGDLVELKGTSGCIRMADEDIKEIKSITDALESYDPQENMTYLTVDNDLAQPIGNFSQSRKEVKNGNGGFWLPDIEVTP